MRLMNWSSLGLIFLVILVAVILGGGLALVAHFHPVVDESAALKFQVRQLAVSLSEQEELNHTMHFRITELERRERIARGLKPYPECEVVFPPELLPPPRVLPTLRVQLINGVPSLSDGRKLIYMRIGDDVVIPEYVDAGYGQAPPVPAGFHEKAWLRGTPGVYKIECSDVMRDWLRSAK